MRSCFLMNSFPQNVHTWNEIRKVQKLTIELGSVESYKIFFSFVDFFMIQERSVVPEASTTDITYIEGRISHVFPHMILEYIFVIFG